MRYHYIRQLLEMKIVDLEYRVTNDMKADGMTKVLGGIKFERFLSILGVSAISKY